MKIFNILIVLLLFVGSCKAQKVNEFESNKTDVSKAYDVFGKKITSNGSILSDNMFSKYATMEVADTVQIKFTGTVTDVCKSKGCWMKLQLKDGYEAMVRFKDYAFFMPKDINGKEVVVNGLAFVEEMDVETQRHYAKDGGKSEKDIAKITEPKKTYGFEADGVLLKK